MALFGNLAAVASQVAEAARFAPAFHYAARSGVAGTPEHARLLALAPGQTERVPLGGGAVAILQVYHTRPADEAKWETHVAAIDVQAIIEGEEFMQVADRGQLTVKEDRAREQDAIFYHPGGPASVLRCGPGSVAVYFPTDAHLGSLAIAGPQLVRKVVVKVPVAVPGAAP